jgi:hypothetical protein
MATSASTSPVQTRPIDPDKLNALLGQAVQDMGAALHAPLIVIGDKLGLYRAMGDGAPVTAAQLAQRTGAAERYIREWLNANAAGKFVEYEPSQEAATSTSSGRSWPSFTRTKELSFSARIRGT